MLVALQQLLCKGLYTRSLSKWMCTLVKAKAEAAHFWLSSVWLKPEKETQDCLCMSGPNKVVEIKHLFRSFACCLSFLSLLELLYRCIGRVKVALVVVWSNWCGPVVSTELSEKEILMYKSPPWREGVV